jgi:hypothetical protein
VYYRPECYDEATATLAKASSTGAEKEYAYLGQRAGSRGSAERSAAEVRDLSREALFAEEE